MRIDILTSVVSAEVTTTLEGAYNSLLFHLYEMSSYFSAFLNPC